MDSSESFDQGGKRRLNQNFETELPSCPFGSCDMRSNHKVVGTGWDFEYHSTREEIDYLQCQSCRLIFPHDIPSESAMPVIYPANYYAFKETEAPNPLVKIVRGWMAKKKGQVYMDMVPLRNAQVVEIGCGDGRLLDILKSSCPDGWKYAGVDWSAQAIERLEAKGYEGRSGDISLLNLDDWKGRFDLAVMHQLIEHVRNPREILEKIGTILKPGGVLTIETPDIESWDYRLLHRRYWSVFHIPRHFYIFDKKNFSKLAEETGYEVISTRSLVNPVAWIHTIKSYCADHPSLSRFAGFFNHDNPVMLAIFTPLEIIQTKLAGTSSNMQINLRKIR